MPVWEWRSLLLEHAQCDKFYNQSYAISLLVKKKEVKFTSQNFLYTKAKKHSKHDKRQFIYFFLFLEPTGFLLSDKQCIHMGYLSENKSPLAKSLSTPQ